MRWFAKPVRGQQPLHGFESRSLRHSYSFWPETLTPLSVRNPFCLLLQGVKWGWQSFDLVLSIFVFPYFNFMKSFFFYTCSLAALACLSGCGGGHFSSGKSGQVGKVALFGNVEVSTNQKVFRKGNLEFLSLGRRFVL